MWPRLLSADTGLVGRAFATGAAHLTVRDLRDFGVGVHRKVDDTPFGGGAGMVLAVPPLHRAIASARERTPGPVVLLTPRGARFTQAQAHSLAQGPGLTLVCGRYEGMDERVRAYVDLELSLGDFVLSAGDPAAFAMIDAVVRLRTGVLGNPASLQEESFANELLEYPHYTRPAEYAGSAVPAVLRSGDHAAIARWRRDQAQVLTAAARRQTEP
jgi:tRNA (guanine37-N1)-methyltransferase